MRSVLALPVLAFAAGCAGDGDVIAARQIDEGLQPDVDAIARGNNQLACDLYQKIAAGGTNTFFSPFSISTALAMVDAGAAGETDAELRAALHFELPGER